LAGAIASKVLPEQATVLQFDDYRSVPEIEPSACCTGQFNRWVDQTYVVI